MGTGSLEAAAHRLGLSHSTVKHDLANARSKVGVSNTAQLVWILAPRLPEPDGSIADDQKRVRVTLGARLPAPEAIAVPPQR
jgi:hypothetical protein